MTWRTRSAQVASVGLACVLINDGAEKLIKIHPNYQMVDASYRSYASAWGLAQHSVFLRRLVGLAELSAAGLLFCALSPTPQNDVYCLGGAVLAAFISFQLSLTLVYERCDKDADLFDAESLHDQILPFSKFAFGCTLYMLKLSTLFMVFPFQQSMLHTQFLTVAAVCIVLLLLRCWKRSHDGADGEPKHTPLQEAGRQVASAV